jgi:hypothetical protein
MLLVSDPRKMSDHGAGILALKDLIPDPAAMPDEEPDEEPDDEEEYEWSFGGPLGDVEPDEALGPWEPAEGQPLEQESFYF